MIIKIYKKYNRFLYKIINVDKKIIKLYYLDKGSIKNECKQKNKKCNDTKKY